MSVRALGIALKLTFSGTNQLFYPQTWAFALIVATCVSTQINYLNKVIVLFCDLFLLQTTLMNHTQIQKVSSFSETCKFDHHDKHMRLTKSTEEIITLVISVLSRIIKELHIWVAQQHFQSSECLSSMHLTEWNLAL